VPIATSEGKEWYKNASEKELKDLKKKVIRRKMIHTTPTARIPICLMKMLS
jgi:Uncharacterized protein conserved in bacteria